MSIQKQSTKSTRHRIPIFSPNSKKIPFKNEQTSPISREVQQIVRDKKSVSTYAIPKSQNYKQVIQHNSLAQQQLRQDKKKFFSYQNRNKQINPNHSPHSLNPSSLSNSYQFKNVQKQLEQQKRFKQYTAHIMSIFMFNQQKLKSIQNAYQSLKFTILSLYNKHEQQLKTKLSNRCQQFTNIFKKSLQIIKAKINYVQQVDYKINLYTNTMKETQQKLKLLKIKQDCLEILSRKKPQNSERNSPQTNYLNFKPTSDKQTKKQNQCLRENVYSFQEQSFQQWPSQQLIENSQKIKQPKQQQVILNSNTVNTMRKFQESSVKHKFNPQNYQQTYAVINTQNIKIPIKNQGYFDFDKDQDQQNLERIDKLSPFETNQLIHGRSSYKSNKHIKYDYQQQKKSHVQANLKPVEITNLRKQIINLINKSSYSNLRNNSKQPLQSLQCYLDHMGHLRRPNGTYIYKSDNSIMVLTNEQYQQLIQEGIIDDSIFRLV